MKYPAKKNQSQQTQPKSATPPPKQTQVSMQWSGPLPPPGALEHFNRIIPGGAERILKLVEQEQEHRLALDRDINLSNSRRANFGQVFGTILAALAIIAAIANTYLGGPWQVGVALVGVPILGVAKALIKNRH
jgi:uncharacterized membrane protein